MMGLYRKARPDELATGTVERAVVAVRIADDRPVVVSLTSFDRNAYQREWVALATADPTRVARVRRLNCRHCHGTDHEYQWSECEYALRCASDMAIGEVPPACLGGSGWRANAEPHPDCHSWGVWA